MTRRRGRPSRVPGCVASCRVEIRLTPEELAAVRRTATRNQCTVADLVRLGVLSVVHNEDDGEDPIVVLGGRISCIVS